MSDPIAEVRPRRSVLYMPGSNARALEKARTLAADTLILDLEDSVAPEAKDEARRLVGEAVTAGGYGPREILIRINGLSTPWGADDLAAALAARPQGILVPKVQSAAELARLNEVIVKADPAGRIALWAMIETPLAILDIRSIAAFATAPGSRLVGFVLGTNDLSKETGTAIVPGRAPMMPWLMLAIAAARAFGLTVIDGVFNGLDDDTGFLAECRQAREMGFDGKTLIHPRQIDGANATFVPDPAEIAWARRIVEVFALAENAAKGALRIDGKMVERLHADMAVKLLQLVDAVEARATAVAA
ncbi:HpcH/HpaI aldolase/citrate lyase family protein [Oryzibacter oryziterrae]|uniref:HpcH/HpaI aldolase/citrate lyase family protein n=1 Tax=Oryzibacter oryziterrae TaxID=2766474 RepID=UPI00210684B0|nr:CoA ester lyase [Oryzibacter oryziterrae]